MKRELTQREGALRDLDAKIGASSGPFDAGRAVLAEAEELLAEPGPARRKKLKIPGRTPDPASHSGAGG